MRSRSSRPSTVRFVGDIVAVVVTRDPRRGSRRRRARDRRLRPAAGRGRPARRRSRTRCCCSPSVGHERLRAASSPASATRACSTAARSSSRDRSSASGWRRARSSRARRPPSMGDDGRLTVWLSTQTPHQRPVRARARARPRARRRCASSAPDVGGGFGAKGLAVEDVLVAWLARQTGRPVRWTETRSESMVAMRHGRGADPRLHDRRRPATARCRRTGSTCSRTSGAYPCLGGFLPALTRLMASGVYRIPRIEYDVPLGRHEHDTGRRVPRRRPAGGDAGDRARHGPVRAEIGIDPAEVRRANFIAPDAFPYTTASGATYDCGDYERALDLALEAAGYESSPRGAAPPAYRGIGAPARDRPQRVRRDHERRRRGGVRRRRDHPRRRRRSSAPARSRTARGTRRRSP